MNIIDFYENAFQSCIDNSEVRKALADRNQSLNAPENTNKGSKLPHDHAAVYAERFGDLYKQFAERMDYLLAHPFQIHYLNEDHSKFEVIIFNNIRIALLPECEYPQFFLRPNPQKPCYENSDAWVQHDEADFNLIPFLNSDNFEEKDVIRSLAYMVAYGLFDMAVKDYGYLKDHADVRGAKTLLADNFLWSGKPNLSDISSPKNQTIENCYLAEIAGVLGYVYARSSAAKAKQVKEVSKQYYEFVDADFKKVFHLGKYEILRDFTNFTDFKTQLGLIKTIRENIAELEFWEKDSFSKMIYVFNTVYGSRNPRITFKDIGSDFFSYENMVRERDPKAVGSRYFKTKKAMRNILNLAPKTFVKYLAQLDDRIWESLNAWMIGVEDSTKLDQEIMTMLIPSFSSFCNRSVHIQGMTDERIQISFQKIYDVAAYFKSKGDGEFASRVSDFSDFLLGYSMEEIGGRLHVTQTNNFLLITAQMSAKNLIKRSAEWHEQTVRRTQDIFNRVARAGVASKHDVEYAKFAEFETDINGFKFTLIRTKKTLLGEATEMQHCIFDYKDQIVAGEYVAFSVKGSSFASSTRIERATLGVYVTKDGFEFDQCKGFKNKSPSYELYNAAKILVQQLKQGAHKIFQKEAA